MVSEKFRYQLRQEIQQWESEGLIDRQIYEQLVIRYRLEELDSMARDRFVLIVIGLGFIIIGLGLITLVAANWQVWSRPIKVFILLSFFIVSNSAGFSLWQSPKHSQAKLGQGLLLLGALSIGANIGLMSQMFHQTGSSYLLYLVWSLAVLLMAYGLRLTSLGILAIILMAIAYGWGVINILGWGREIFGQELQQMPLIVSSLFISLAYYCRSRWLFGLTIILTSFALAINLGQYANISDSIFQSFATASLAVLIPACFWTYRDNLLFPSIELPHKFESFSRKFAIFYLCLVLYVGSFNAIWHSSNYPQNIDGSLENISFLIAPLIFSLFSIWAWWKSGQRSDENFPWRLERDSAAIGLFLAIIGGLIGVNTYYSLHETGTIIFNLMLFCLGIGLIRQSVNMGQRLSFWSGILLLSLQLLSRMFEYSTGLIFKAIVLFVCGLAIILAGLWFERYLNNFTTTNNN
ncbi:MAG: DUF2157 domain-containing protein [Pleurocapsa sp.]